MYEYAEKKNTSIGNLNTQIEFLYREIIGNAYLSKELNECYDVTKASNLILHSYEKPADQSKAAEDKRAGYAIEVFKRYGDKQEDLVKTEEKTELVEFKVRVSIPNLNIRFGPGVQYGITGNYTGVGVFTIVEEKDGWGKLKSEVGWICLKYTQRM